MFLPGKKPGRVFVVTPVRIYTVAVVSMLPLDIKYDVPRPAPSTRRLKLDVIDKPPVNQAICPSRVAMMSDPGDRSCHTLLNTEMLVIEPDDYAESAGD